MTAQSTGTSIYDRCRAFLDSNFVDPPPRKHKEQAAVAISRESFTHGHEIAEALIRRLDRDPVLGKRDWALFDRNLVEKILEDHHLPKTIAKYMPEDRDRDFTGTINEILGLHPSLWELFHYTCDTILKLADTGNVILMGRGAHVITRGMPHVLQARIVAPLPLRVERAMDELNISKTEATRKIKQDDQARAAYVRSHFDEDICNPFAYHMTLNTGILSINQAAELLYAAIQER